MSAAGESGRCNLRRIRWSIDRNLLSFAQPLEPATPAMQISWRHHFESSFPDFGSGNLDDIRPRSQWASDSHLTEPRIFRAEICANSGGGGPASDQPARKVPIWQRVSPAEARIHLDNRGPRPPSLLQTPHQRLADRFIVGLRDSVSCNVLANEFTNEVRSDWVALFENVRDIMIRASRQQRCCCSTPPMSAAVRYDTYIHSGSGHPGTAASGYDHQ
jgi:hypothetical protein